MTEFTFCSSKQLQKKKLALCSSWRPPVDTSGSVFTASWSEDLELAGILILTANERHFLQTQLFAGCILIR